MPHVCICSHTDTHKHRTVKDRRINGFNHKVLLSYLSVETQGREPVTSAMLGNNLPLWPWRGPTVFPLPRTPSLCTWEKQTHTFSGPGLFLHSQSLWEKWRWWPHTGAGTELLQDGQQGRGRGWSSCPHRCCPQCQVPKAAANSPCSLLLWFIVF